MALEALSGKTVLVTGAGGLVGSRITAKLRSLGARAISVCKLDAYPEAVYREQFGIDRTKPDFVVGDISEPGLMKGAVAGCDYVVHAAALADVAACTRRPLEAIESNIVGTERVLDAVAGSGRVRRLVFVRSLLHGGAVLLGVRGTAGGQAQQPFVGGGLVRDACGARTSAAPERWGPPGA